MTPALPAEVKEQSTSWPWPGMCEDWRGFAWPTLRFEDAELENVCLSFIFSACDKPLNTNKTLPCLSAAVAAGISWQ